MRACASSPPNTQKESILMMQGNYRSLRQNIKLISNTVGKSAVYGFNMYLQVKGFAFQTPGRLSKWTQL